MYPGLGELNQGPIWHSQSSRSHHPPPNLFHHRGYFLCTKQGSDTYEFIHCGVVRPLCCRRSLGMMRTAATHHFSCRHVVVIVLLSNWLSCWLLLLLSVVPSCCCCHHCCCHCRTANAQRPTPSQWPPPSPLTSQSHSLQLSSPPSPC